MKEDRKIESECRGLNVLGEINYHMFWPNFTENSRFYIPY